MISPYRQHISLGHTCQTAHYIKNLIGWNGSNFFDDLIIPPTAIPPLLRSNSLMSLFVNPKGFKVTAKGSLKSIVEHTDTGIIFNHDFPYFRGLSALDKVILRYSVLAKQWDDCIIGNNILFIRHRASRDETLAINRAIYEKYPKLEYNLLVINEGKPTNWGISRVFDETFEPADVEWCGEIASWTRIFNKLKII